MNVRRTSLAWLLLSVGCLIAGGCEGAPGGGPPGGRPTAEEMRRQRERFERQFDMQPRLAVVSAVRVTGVKETAADALARIGAEAVPPLIEALTDPDAEVRLQATRALARMGLVGRDAVPALITALSDENKLVRQGAARALGQMGPAAREAIPALIQALKDPANRTDPLPSL
jgi:HEAT repeat protein